MKIKYDYSHLKIEIICAANNWHWGFVVSSPDHLIFVNNYRSYDSDIRHMYLPKCRCSQSFNYDHEIVDSIFRLGGLNAVYEYLKQKHG